MVDWLLGLPAVLVCAALFGLVAAESAGLPVPGETGLIAAGALAARPGQVPIGVVVAVAAAAAIVGDNVGFAIGRHGGRRLLLREGRLADTRRRTAERGERFFTRHGPKAVFLARWLPGLRVAGAWLAGSLGMPWRRFLAWNALGGICWAVSIGIGAYLLGNAMARIARTFGLGGLALVAVAAAGIVGWRLLRRRRAARVSGTRAPPRDPDRGQSARG
jgi:undecaprenyl-diphosphatase